MCVPYVTKSVQMWLNYGSSRWALSATAWTKGQNGKETTRDHREQVMCRQNRGRSEDAALKTGVMGPPIKAGWLASNISWNKKARDTPLEGVRPAIPWFQFTDNDFKLLASRTEREYISVVLSYPVCANRLQQSHETPTAKNLQVLLKPLDTYPNW